MTPEGKTKVSTVVAAALSVLPQERGCDDVFEYFAAYAESKLTGSNPPASSQLVAEHLERCPCCLEEFDLLLESLKVPGLLNGKGPSTS